MPSFPGKIKTWMPSLPGKIKTWMPSLPGKIKLTSECKKWLSMKSNFKEHYNALQV
jgi:hypothetical protein